MVIASSLCTQRLNKRTCFTNYLYESWHWGQQSREWVEPTNGGLISRGSATSIWLDGIHPKLRSISEIPINGTRGGAGGLSLRRMKIERQSNWKSFNRGHYWWEMELMDVSASRIPSTRKIYNFGNELADWYILRWTGSKWVRSWSSRFPGTWPLYNSDPNQLEAKQTLPLHYYCCY